MLYFNNKKALTIICGIFLVLCFSSCAKEPQSPMEVALELVRISNAGKNMKVLALKVAPRTQTYAAIIASVGPEEAKQLVDSELDAKAPLFQKRWNENVAKAHLQHLSPEEIESIIKYRDKSPHKKKFVQAQGAIGESMQPTATNLLNAYVTAALTSAFEKTISN